jgi:hypothetical protein
MIAAQMGRKQAFGAEEHIIIVVAECFFAQRLRL